MSFCLSVNLGPTNVNYTTVISRLIAAAIIIKLNFEL